MKSFFRFICVLMLSASFSCAQVSIGNQPLGSFSSGPDITNLGNLNVHYDIPIFSKPGRGIPFNYGLSFDNSIWYPASGAWTPMTNWGWESPSEVVSGGIRSVSITTRHCIDPDTGFTVFYTTSTFSQYQDNFGTIHPVAAFYVQDSICGPGSSTPGTTTDGSGFTITPVSSSNARVTSRSGQIIQPFTGAGFGSGSTSDSNGNTISSSSGAFTDTLGMPVLTATGGAPSPVVFTYKDSTGTSQSVTITYTSATVKTNFGCSGISEYGPTSVNLVSSISYPDGSSYSFTYEPTPGFTGDVTGRLQQVTLRTGGTIAYAYTGTNSGIECADGSTGGFDRTTSDGTVSYSRTGGGTNWATTIKDATPVTRNQTVVNFQTIGTPALYLETHRSVNQGASTELVHTDTCYNGATVPCTSTAVALPFTSIARYTTPAGGSQSATKTSVNSNGLPTEVDEYDFGGVTPLRKTITTYATLTNNILDRPSSIVIQDGSSNQITSTTFTYDDPGTLTGTTGVPQHNAVTGSRGNPTTITQWVSSSAASLVTKLTYDDTGNVLTSSDPANNTTTFDYTDNFSEGAPTGTLAYLTKITLPSTGSPAVSHITHTQYEANTGLAATTTDFNGNQTTYTYDLMLRPLTINAPDGGQTSYSYPSPTSTVQNQLITATQTASITTTVDGYGRVLHQQLTSDPAGTDTVDTGYDTNGRISSVSNPHRIGSSPTDGTTSYVYDALGRVTQQTQPDTNTIQASFSGSCVTLTDEAGKQRKNCFDALGRIASAFEPDSTNAFNWETDNAYNPLNNVVSITQKGGSTVSTQWRTRTFAYDGLSRMTQAVAPESGTTNYYYTTSGGALCAGDAASQCRITDARSITTTLAYDAVNRVTGKTYSDTTPAVSYFYDQTSSSGLTITYGNGLRTGMSDGSGTTAWSYDKMGRVATRQQTIATVTKSIGYTYNLDGSAATMTYPSGRVYTYTYNNAGQIASLIDTVHNLKFFSSPQYAPPGMLTSGIHGAVTGWNAITLTNTYNNRLEPTQFQAVSPVPLTLLNLSYSYDQGSGKNNADVVQITNGRDSTRTTSYTYDQVNRLATAQTPTAATWGDSYVYDAWGNLLQKNVIKGTAETMALTVNAHNQVTTPAFSYDAAGNVTSDTSVGMTYDAEGRMNRTSGTTYTYDGDGRRVEKSDGTVYWVDDSFLPISVGTTSGSITRDYVFLGQKRIAHVTIASGNAYYYLDDHLGSTAVVASGDGKSIQWEADFFPFGAQRQVFTSTAGVSYQFTGYEYDSDTQYNYAVARFDAGRWGRFLSPDSYLGSMNLGDPQSLNKYAYVENDPIDFIDPLGLNKTSIIIVGNCIVQQVYGSDDGRPYLISSSTIFCGAGGGSTTGAGNGGGTPADMWGITDPRKRDLFNCTAAANQQFNTNSKNQTPTPPSPSQVLGLSGPSIAGSGTSYVVSRLLGGTPTRGIIGYTAKVIGVAGYDLIAGAVEATKNFIGYNSIDNQIRAACHALFGN